jgi:5'-nucleotidase
VRRRYVSITPIHVDLTRYQALEQVARWVAEISLAGRKVEGAGT